MKINYKKDFISIGISIATISDTRNIKTDKSGKILEKKILEHGHELIEKKIITDDTKEIRQYFNDSIKNSAINVIITTGGSGLTDRDSTVDILDKFIEKEIPGFGEIFRMISFKKLALQQFNQEPRRELQKVSFCFVYLGRPQLVLMLGIIS